MKTETESTTARSDSILWNEFMGFLLMILMTWLTEILHIPYLVFGEPFTPNWHRATIRTVVILLIWAWVNWITRRLLKRLHQLEEFLRICSWCRKVGHKDQWLTMEDFFNSKFSTHTTHGMCPECLAKAVKEIGEKPAKTD